MQDILEVIRVMAALAWSDGVLDQAEADSLRRLIERAGLPDDARWQAMNYVEFETKLGEINLDALSEDERRSMYRAAEALAVIDDHLDAAEEKVLARLRAALHVRREDIAAAATGQAAAPRPGPTKVRAKPAARKPAKKKKPRRAAKPKGKAKKARKKAAPKKKAAKRKAPAKRKAGAKRRKGKGKRR